MENVVSLLSDEDVVEILSSSPPSTPVKPQDCQSGNKRDFRACISSSPLFEHEKRLRSEVPFDVDYDNDTCDDASNKLEHASINDDRFETEPEANDDTVHKESTPSAPKLNAYKAPSFLENKASVSATHENTIADEPIKPLKPVTASATITDRKKAAHNMTCHIWGGETDTMLSFISRLKEQFGSLEVEIRCESRKISLADGISAIITAEGRYEDEWNDEHNSFIKAPSHVEQLFGGIAVLSPDFLDTLGHFSFEKRSHYFTQVSGLIKSLTTLNVPNTNTEDDFTILYMIPEVGIYFKKCVDKFNRAMRKRISTQSQSLTGDEPLIPPSEQFYTDLETELQILHELRAFYPRKMEDCIEMVANCVIDWGYRRYHMQSSEVGDTYGGSVRSKSNVLDITAESLTKIQGLPPRISTKLASDVTKLGKLQDYFGDCPEMRASRIKRFGKGAWNSSLLKFLECEDPNAVI